MKKTLATLAVCSLAAAALLGSGGVQRAAAAELGDPAYCPYGSVSGTGLWAPGVTALITPETIQLSLQATCTGVADETGTYSIVLAGSSNESCGAGTGAGTVAGTAPEGAMSGSFTFFKIGIHYYISGSFTAGGESHNLQLWIDVLPSATVNGVCAYGSAPLIGHGAILEMINITVTPPALGVVAFAGSTTLLTPIEPLGGAGVYAVSTSAAPLPNVPGVCEEGLATGIASCTLNAAGTYASILAGTGITGGGPLVESDSATITTGNLSTTVDYSIVFAAGHGIITGTWSASDGTSGTAGGYVDIAPTGVTGTVITKLAAVGALALV